VKRCDWDCSHTHSASRYWVSPQRISRGEPSDGTWANATINNNYDSGAFTLCHWAYCTHHEHIDRGKSPKPNCWDEEWRTDFENVAIVKFGAPCSRYGKQPEQESLF
jgi:hypothetical protein